MPVEKFDKTIMETLYTEYASIRRVAKEMGCSTTIVSDFLKKKGIQTRSTGKRMPEGSMDVYFMAKIVKDDKTGCWDWIASKNSLGYGLLTIKGKSIKAHRYSYTRFNGDLKDLLVLHKCDNPGCVNPDHLFLGTHKDNSKDMVIKGRHRNKWTGPIKSQSTHLKIA